ncbi:staygreen family protein [Dendrosporobacter sp. 1207_IL3150]|uniref:staygreen family protein n=1 Tax=Dendrosporobacter sp. 1207_IL3150 TaxID=3084054 RepID=UPI002FD977A3
MNRLAPAKLTTKLRNVTRTEPIIPRRYTLTHSDETAKLFLSIGQEYAYDEITAMRDEVLAEWCWTMNGYKLCGFVQIDLSPTNKLQSVTRFSIFKRELPLVLEAIRFGDRRLFEQYPFLDYSDIYIHYSSVYSELSGCEYWGIPRNYI